MSINSSPNKEETERLPEITITGQMPSRLSVISGISIGTVPSCPFLKYVYMLIFNFHSYDQMHKV